MASLFEIGLEYERSAEPIRKRLKELRVALTQTADPDEVWKLKQRIKELTPLLTECNKLARHCKCYYERGYYINGGAFPDGRNDRSTNEKPASLQGVSLHYEKRADRPAKGNAGRVSIGRENLYGICKRAGSKQVNSISNLLSGN